MSTEGVFAGEPKDCTVSGWNVFHLEYNDWMKKRGVRRLTVPEEIKKAGEV